MIYDIKNIAYTKEVYDIYSLCMYLPNFEKYNAMISEYSADSNTNVYGFYDNNILVGVIAIRNNTDKKAEILGIAVKFAYRNKGIGNHLIQHSLKKNEVKELFAETDDDAVLFYRRCGFQTEEFYKTYNTNKTKRYKCTYYSL